MAALTVFKVENINGEDSCGDIGVSTQEWYDLLCKKEAQQYLDALICFLREPNNTGSCMSVAFKYGKDRTHFTSKITHFSKWVEKELNRFVVKDSWGYDKYWCIAMQKGWYTAYDFQWQLRNELAEALQMLLMRNLIDEYKKREPFNGYEEEYKWKLLEETNGLPVIDIIKKLYGINIIDNQRVDVVFKFLNENKKDDLLLCINHLLEESKPIDNRINAFKKEMRNLCPADWKNCANDERTASAILTCRYPEKYTFFKDEVYQLICQYFGIDSRQTGLKYSHYTDLINKWQEIYGKEIQILMSPVINQFSIKPENISIQTLFWCMRDYLKNSVANKIRNYWLVGYCYGSKNSQFDRFINEAIWDSYFDNNSKEDINQLQLARHIKQGDILILKSALTKGANHDQPFLRVKAVAVVESNIETEKEDNKTFCHCKVSYYGIKDLDFDNASLSSFRKTIHHINNDSKAQPIIDYANSILDMDINKANNMDYQEYVNLLKSTHNLILTGAPGTGKTYLAKKIAEAMGCTENEIGFVQFHPSYDYTDFVEGLRPINDENGNIGFERKDGVFKEFCARALEKYDTKNFDDAFDSFLNEVMENGNVMELTTPSGARFSVSVNQRKNLTFFTGIEKKVGGSLTRKGVKTEYEGKPFYKYWLGYYNGVINYIKSKYSLSNVVASKPKDFIFIIDEINRGEISKIFGELFFSIDPGYRGEKGRVQTQYQNIVEDGDVFKKGFFVPENVYIIGTMNDIDRSVESMDFAFRRRFAFKEIKANENIAMLDQLGDLKDEAVTRMANLNATIEKVEGLSSAYHIGASYFLKIQDYGNDFSKLWEYHLEELLREYLRGMQNVEDTITKLKSAYDDDSQGQQQNAD